MEEKVNKILELLIAGIEKGTELAESELPGLMQEYITYYYIKAIPISSILIGLLSIVTAIVCAVLYRKFKKGHGDAWVDCMIYGTLAVLILIASIGCSSSGFMEMYQIKEAPKAYLIERLRR